MPTDTPTHYALGANIPGYLSEDVETYCTLADALEAFGDWCAMLADDLDEQRDAQAPTPTDGTDAR